MHTPEVKICGLKEREAVDGAIAAGADYLGLVFYPPSPRHVSTEQAIALKRHIRTHSAVPLVAVTVDPDKKLLDAIAKELAPDWLQLHGTETPQQVAEIRRRYGIPVIKALPIRNGDDVALAMAYGRATDALLFDARAPQDASHLPGGNGLQFDWRLLQGREFALPWFLSGGLNAENVRQAIRLTGATRVDVSSSVESSPGRKDPERIRQFIATAKHGDTA